MITLRADRVHLPDDEVRPAVLVLDGGSIRDIRSGSATADVDLGDVTLLPGLVDTHVHLGFDCSPDVLTPLLEDDDDVLLERMADNARRALQAGVTTVRDLGDRRFLSLALREQLRRNPTAGPELLVAGPPITRTKGHCWFLGGEADTAEELRAAVRERAERGCDAVKVMATGGVLTPGYQPHESQFGLAELTAIVTEARAVGLPVAAHAHGPEGIRAAVAAGVDSVEHCSWFTADGVEPDWEVVRAMADLGIAAVPSLGVLPGIPAPPAIAARIERMEAVVLRMVQLGVRVVLGTDAGIAPSKPHDVLPRAVLALTEIGVPFGAALEAATFRAAELCGVGERKGRLAVGYDADLLAVHGDPWADPAALLDVHSVHRAGVRVR